MITQFGRPATDRHLSLRIETRELSVDALDGYFEIAADITLRHAQPVRLFLISQARVLFAQLQQEAGKAPVQRRRR